MDIQQIQSALTGLAGATLLRFDVPYPEPKTGVIAALGFDQVEIEVIRSENGIEILRNEPLKKHRGWARLHPGMRIRRAHAYPWIIAGTEKLVIELETSHTWAQLVIGQQSGCTLMFPW
jgi:hypothetical protein